MSPSFYITQLTAIFERNLWSPPMDRYCFTSHTWEPVDSSAVISADCGGVIFRERFVDVSECRLNDIPWEYLLYWQGKMRDPVVPAPPEAWFAHAPGSAFAVHFIAQ